ncbi:Mrx4p LALA0_S01e04236g [Lachancea lanzarotensis]|uniref:LALA0S01e04236g1_1 n=1 Tax=Lachancea lanzarotensis TaxID=1245769 RepID=A0A0C7MSC9_9SACH|nr:uncharacterized protein LALA0_S01e04236g [Lachancea lanzarotensis]CEP60154.1 LALA0S01e04236g1_1 [Lachancea lanzarotensis]
MIEGTRLFIRLELRFYGTRASKRASNSRDMSILKYNTSKQNRHLLLVALEQQLKTGKFPSLDTQLNATVSILAKELLPDTTASLQQLRKLFQLILQGKVSARHIDRAWNGHFVKQEGMVNVAEPQRKTKTLRTAQKAGSDLLELHPSTPKEFHRTLDTLGLGMANTGTTKPGPESKWQPPAMTRPGDINLSSLQSFLQTTEKSKREQRQFATEQTRKYQWNQNSANPTAWSPGMLLFENNTSRRRSVFSKIFHWRGLGMAQPDNRGNQAPMAMSTELLIYDLEKGTRLLTSWKAQLTNIHIEYKDLFTVINGSSKSPEHLLKVITDLERDKWQLIGDSLVDGARKLVFKRGSAEGAGKTGFSRATNVVLAILLAGFTTYGFELRQQRLQATNSIKYHHHAQEI